MTPPSRSDPSTNGVTWTVGRLPLLPLDMLIVSLLVLEEVARPVYRPLARWLASLQLIKRLENAVAGFPAYAALLVLAIPFLGAEPFKVVGAYWMGTGHFLRGVATEVFAYAVSFLLVERIYHAGRPQLLTIRWFATLVSFVAKLKETALMHLRATRLWQSCKALAQRAKLFIRRRPVTTLDQPRV